VGTVNVGCRALTCPLLLWCYSRGDPLPYTTDGSDQNTDRIGFPIQRSENHIPNNLEPVGSGLLHGVLGKMIPRILTDGDG
jgi:hypothetical protein